jgi:hypothetical protein
VLGSISCPDNQSPAIKIYQFLPPIARRSWHRCPLQPVCARADLPARAAAMQDLVEGIVSGLQERGYAERCQIVWAQDSQDVPYKWEINGPAVVRMSDDTRECLKAFQVRSQPAAC